MVAGGRGCEACVYNSSMYKVVFDNKLYGILFSPYGELRGCVWDSEKVKSTIVFLFKKEDFLSLSLTQKYYQFLLVMLVLITSTFASLSHTLPDQTVDTTITERGVIFEDCVTMSVPGHPNLPVYKASFLVPANADISNIVASIEGLQVESVTNAYGVDAAGPWTFGTKAQWPNEEVIVDGKDTTIYNQNAFYPNKHIGAVTVGKYRQYLIVDVTVFPYQYNPVTKELRKISAGALVLGNIAYPPSSGETYEPVKASEDTYLRNLVVNPDAIDSYNGGLSSFAAPMSAGVDLGVYAIITTEAIKNGSEKLDDFIASKERRGFTVQVITEAQWGGGVGDAAAENLRAWLQANYVTMGIEYVLLIGNPHPVTGDVPMKECFPFDENAHGVNAAHQIYWSMTDHYYGDLSNTWDFDGDGRFGENGGVTTAWGSPDIGDYGRNGGGADKHCEVIVGRFPVYNNNFTDLDAIMEKTIRYDNDNSIEWRKKVLLPMEPPYENHDAYELGENIKDDILETQSWEYVRVYDDHNAYDGFPIHAVNNLQPAVEYIPCNEANVAAAWRANDIGLTIWFTHGSPTSADGVFNSASASALNNDKPAIVFMGSCNNAYPERSDNLAYSVLKNGGIASIAATRPSWGPTPEYEYTNSSSVGGMGYKFANQIVAQGNDVGLALKNVKSALETSQPYYWFNLIDFNIYGDPAVNVNHQGSGNPVEYTIGTGGDYTTFTDAVNFLKSTTISTPVIFNVKSGTYCESVVIPEIDGASEVNTITFKSETGLVESVNLKPTDGSSNEWALTLDGADYVIFRNLSIKFIHSDAGGVTLINGASNNTFRSNHIVGSSTGAVGVKLGAGAGNDANTFISNNVGGGNAIICRGESGQQFFDNVFRNNTLTGYIPFIAYELCNSVISGNFIPSRVYAITLRNSEDVTIEKNTLYGCMNGIRLHNCSDASIFNNYARIGGEFGPNQEDAPRQGFYLIESSGKVYHNTVVMLKKNTGDALFIKDAGTLDVKNNLLVTTSREGTVLKVENSDNLTLDNNNYYNDPAESQSSLAIVEVGSTNPAWDATATYNANDRVSYDGHDWECKWNTTTTPSSVDPYGPWRDLGAYTTETVVLHEVTASIGENSISVDPQFTAGTGAARYMVSNSDLMAGVSIPEVTEDIDGNGRAGSNPTIGAWEMIASRMLPYEYRLFSEGTSNGLPDYTDPDPCNDVPSLTEMDFLLPDEIVKDSLITFENISLATYESMNWFVNDEDAGNSDDLNYAFTEAGVYTVTLTGMRADSTYQSVRKIFEVTEGGECVIGDSPDNPIIASQSMGVSVVAGDTVYVLIADLPDPSEWAYNTPLRLTFGNLGSEYTIEYSINGANFTSLIGWNSTVTGGTAANNPDGYIVAITTSEVATQQTLLNYLWW